MIYKIIFFVDTKGACPVEEYMEKLSAPQQDKVFAYLRRLQEVGPQLKRPAGDYLGGKIKLYELRPGRHRILYYFHGKNIVLLHAFLKKTDEIPKKDIELALFRKDICEVQFKHGRIETGD
ncbi:MAG: type II toxin-antitoxin system RelE/ParE family toxin [Candidatus Omnitrophica bacterium]|nr:type II toxin-antitoxin system RelE/ParE family toxin [Candidatus Omnitrophota bacterium]